MKSSTFSETKSNSHPLKFKPAAAFSKETNFIWSNLAFMEDDYSDKGSIIGSNIILGSPTENKRREYFNTNVEEEEIRIREELAREIEKELERELMEGRLVLVRRLSVLKAKQIDRGLKDLNLDKLSSEICPSHCCNVDGDRVSQWLSMHPSAASEISQAADDYPKK
ncbi:unnamed protein product [Dovyalis caffra]|uniref:Uncharacterized protein n=1 Tax=Dovyalis caffra TaxID=77055 RepID=A0AAV1S7D1_9ROSI|nr:unnamed protein product [Dovyalis caffra]